MAAVQLTSTPAAATNPAITLSERGRRASPNSTTPSAASLLNWRVNEQSAGVTTVPELAPGASTTLSLQHPFGSAGVFHVVCQLEANDDLPPDNEAQLLVEIYERLPVLLVEDPLSTEALDNDTPFILAALGSRKDGAKLDWRSVFEPTVIIVVGGAVAFVALAQV